MEPFTLLALCATAVVAGFVDAVAGGGGLLTLPALILAGLPPSAAIATNKLQGTFGVASASYVFWRKGLIDFEELRSAIVATAFGAVLGSLCVGAIDNGTLRIAVPLLLILVALYFAFAPNLAGEPIPARVSPIAFAIGICLPIGFYDGFLGPGTGSFFMLAMAALAGRSVLSATARTKLLNFVSNIAALGVFLAAGKVVFFVGIPMAFGQALGAQLGAHAALRHGARLIRPLVVVASIAIAIRFLVAQ